MKKKDFRINDMLSAGKYVDIANEYLHKMGREVNGGYEMSATEFKTKSYRRNHTEKQLDVTINYKEQTIEIVEI
ncbi:MAG: hypothetical protein IAA73_07525 [Bacteroidetes bacterium]|uniref:Uncharacterized protein n=1 Tax=Candidatus Gallipaludibacter merdavium TaxID=2840839 RepID=A0A9D9HUL8_9BACT|nr:hypothetical protein [Candidatus Gallipaludibacter merdavium]